MNLRRKKSPSTATIRTGTVARVASVQRAERTSRGKSANLKPPVTTKPSKLKPGSKKAKRRKSFCARMSGAKGPTSKGGKLTPKGAALKRWNC